MLFSRAGFTFFRSGSSFSLLFSFKLQYKEFFVLDILKLEDDKKDCSNVKKTWSGPKFILNFPKFF